jgi:hypothetical protein
VGVRCVFCFIVVSNMVERLMIVRADSGKLPSGAIRLHGAAADSEKREVWTLKM